MSDRILAPLLALCLLYCAVSAEAALTTAHSDFTPADLKIAPRESYQELSIEGCVNLGEVGAPALPVEILRFVIPPDTRVSDVVLSELDEMELTGSFRVRPIQPDVPTGRDPVWADPDPSIYESDAPYPSARVLYLGDGYLGGYRIAAVAFYPIQYKPRSGKLTLASSFSVDLELDGDTVGALPRQRLTPSSNELYRGMVRRLVVNPDDVDRASPRTNVIADSDVEGFLPRYTPSLEGSPVEYVVVTSDEFADQFQSFADWKTRLGIPAVVRSMSWIDANYAGGVDSAERIRMFLQDAYESWGTTYVLLGGDTDVVPARFAKSVYSGGDFIPADIYYSCLDGDWNGDGDSYFGEGFAGGDEPGDSTDFYPEVFVGRAPVNTPIEVETFISKCHSYIEAPDPLFTARDLILAEVLFPYDWVEGPYSFDGASDVIEPVIDLFPDDVHLARLYANTEEFPDANPLNAVTALDSLQAGYNVTFHVGHANKDILRAGTGNYISMGDISALSGGIDKSSFIWMLNCTAAAIDYDCIAERAVLNPNGASVGVFGSTRMEFPGTSKEYLWQWIDLLYTQSLYRAGEVCALAKAAFASPVISGNENSHRWTQLSLLLVGDPALPIWTSRAAPLTVSHPDSISVGQSMFSVTVSDASGPVEGAKVCLLKDGDVYDRGTTGPDGVVYADIVADSEGTLEVTVTAHDHFPSETTMAVTPATGVYIHLAAFSVEDGAAGGSGNGNGSVESGETVELGADVGNVGGTGAFGVVAMLSTDDIYVTISDDLEAVGSLGAGEEVSLPEAFGFVVSDSCPDEHDVSFEVSFTDELKNVWTEELCLRIHRPDLRVLMVEVDDGAGDGDGIPELGETVELEIELWNEGTGDAGDVSGVLRSTGEAVTVIDSLNTWICVSGGGQVSGSTGFSYSVDLEPVCDIEIELVDERGRMWTQTLDIVPPDKPVNLSGAVDATTIHLSWDPCLSPDLRGYAVYRSFSESGPFVRVSSGVLESGSRYEDAGLLENTVYYYYVTSIDNSGNHSAASGTLTISTNPPSQPGWPLVTGGGMYSSPALADIDGDGQLEIVIGSEHIYAWRYDGTEVIDGDGDPRTGGVFEIDGDGGYRCSPAVGELDGDSGLEIVAAAFGDASQIESGIYEVYAWNAEDGTIVPGWPTVTKRFCWASPVLTDLDMDGLAEVAIACADGNLYCWRGDGTEFIDGDNNPTTPGVFANLRASYVYASTAAADLDGDHVPELIQPSANDSVYAFHADGSRVDGWPVYTISRPRCSPAVGDVDGDGSAEVLIGSNASKFWLLRGDGTPLPGWPRTATTAGDFPPSPVLADLDGDDLLEAVVVGSAGRIAVFRSSGAMLPGWPKDMGVSTLSSPIVADLDDDPEMEILVSFADGMLYAFDVDGATVSGWPIQTGAEIHGTPAVADLDGDGDNEIVVGGMDTKVHVWDCEGTYAGGDGIEWGSFLHDAVRSQDYSFHLLTGVDGDPVEQIGRSFALDQNCPNPFNPVTEIGFRIPEGQGQDTHVTLTVYTVAGSVVRKLVDGRVPHGYSTVVWDGRDDGGRPVASGVYFYRLAYDGGSQARSMVLMK